MAHKIYIGSLKVFDPDDYDSKGTASGLVGTLASLLTTAKTNAVAAINEVIGYIGTLASLTTTVKTSIVAAVNELVTKIGTLTSLTTTEKGSAVGAINEVHGEVVTARGASANLDARLDGLDSQLAQITYTTVSDTTYNSAWISGAPSVSTIDGIITLAGHGLTANTPIEFDSGTGTLPTGITRWDSDMYGGEYYNVIYIDENTFKITAKVGGDTPVIPTDAGVSGWKIRKATFADNTNFGSTSIAVGEEIEITVSGQLARIANSTEAFRPYLNDPATRSIRASGYLAYLTSGYGTFKVATSGAKYSNHAMILLVKYISASLMYYEFKSISVSTANKTAYNAEADINIHGYIPTPAISTVSIGIVTGYGAARLRNGMRCIVRRKKS